jgi:hypothetical protein
VRFRKVCEGDTLQHGDSTKDTCNEVTFINLYLIIKYARVPWFGSSRVRFMGHGPILGIPPFVKIFT